MGLQFGSTTLADIDQTDGQGLKVGRTFFPIDEAEEGASAPYNANPHNGLTTLENVLYYGAGKFIDNGFTTRPRLGNYDTGGGAGNSGRTYQNVSGAEPRVLGAGVPSSWLLIGGAAVAGLLLLR